MSQHPSVVCRSVTVPCLFVVVIIVIDIVSAIAIAFVVVLALIAVINWRGLLG